jgi:hypothetical protein
MLAQDIPQVLHQLPHPRAAVALDLRLAPVGLKARNARLEDVVLFEVSAHAARLPRKGLDLREGDVLLDLVVVVHEVAPGFDVEKDVGDVGGEAHVGCLQVDAVHATEDAVVDVGHFVGAVDGAVGFLGGGQRGARGRAFEVDLLTGSLVLPGVSRSFHGPSTHCCGAMMGGNYV